MLKRGEARAPTLARLVVEALVKIGLTQEEVLLGPITHATLPWQIPALVVEAPIFEVPFSDYIDTPMVVNVEALVNLWSDALSFMRNRPDKVLTPDGYRATSYALPHLRAGERQLHLSMPDGYPGGITDYAGATLSLECAHLLSKNARTERFVSDEDNYYVTLPGGTEVGVKNGLPSMYDDQWDLPVSGMVQEMLRTPRGAVWEGCDHDIIAKLRSVCYDYQKSIKDYEAVEWALQTLRIIKGQQQLLDAVRSIKSFSYMRGMRMRALKEALTVSKQVSLTDRQRVDALKAILVPEVLSSAKFTKQVYSYYIPPPPMLTEKALARLQAGVQELHDNEERLYAQKGPL